jgi:hypothetical protein
VAELGRPGGIVEVEVEVEAEGIYMKFVKGERLVLE